MSATVVAGGRLFACDHGQQLSAVDRGGPQPVRRAVRVRDGRRRGQRDRVPRERRPVVQGARAGGPVRPPGRHVHGAGAEGRDEHCGGRRHDPSAAALRHVPVVVRHAVRAGGHRGRVHREPGHGEHRPEAVQNGRAGRGPRVRHLLPDRLRRRSAELGREPRVPLGQL